MHWTVVALATSRLFTSKSMASVIVSCLKPRPMSKLNSDEDYCSEDVTPRILEGKILTETRRSRCVAQHVKMNKVRGADEPLPRLENQRSQTKR
ncbi:hypothetical protein QR685DRAFT_162622 [Neurospora intermedia]|uniref:Uncharacterized protein n=1 Tax=Neurospora intermedia TaxID=5142 RepID=A0ABR3DKA3_NEUIN